MEKKPTRIIIAIFLTGLLLRIIALFRSPLGPDEQIMAVHSFKFIDSLKLSQINPSPVFFAINDLAIKLFGFGLLSTRMTGLVFGSLSVIMVYLIGEKLFGEKTGLVASLLFAVSPYAVKWGVIESDMGAVFFVLLSFYFFLKFNESNNSFKLYLSAVFLGLGFLFKPIALLVLPVYLVYWFVWKRRLRVGEIKVLAISCFLFLLVLSPVLIHNYSLYREKGITDIYFARYLDAGYWEGYDGIGGRDDWSFEKFLRTYQKFAKRFITTDPVTSVLTILGAPFTILSLFILFGSVMTLGFNASPTHFLIIVPFMCLIAAMLFRKKGKLLFVTISVLILVSFVMSGVGFMSDNPSGELRSFVKNIPDDSLIIVDPVIYNGLSNYAFIDKRFITGIEVMQMQEETSGSGVAETGVYYVECSKSTCLTSTKEYDALKELSIFMTDRTKEYSDLVKTIEGDEYGFKVYKIRPREVYKVFIDKAETPRDFFYYQVGYSEDDYDNYQRGLLHYIGLIILWIDVLLALLSPIIVWRALRCSTKTMKN